MTERFGWEAALNRPAEGLLRLYDPPVNEPRRDDRWVELDTDDDTAAAVLLDREHRAGVA